MASRRRYAASALILSALFLLGGPASAEVSLGLEGFYDRYREPDVGVDNHAEYGSLTGHYAHSWGSIFGAIDARGSYGQNTYSSPDGTASGIPQYELEGRLRAGFSIPVPGGALTPYTGFGTRYFIDEGKGTLTTLGYLGYDRRITQIYLPLGATYSFKTDGGWTFAPNFEYDAFLWGNVNTRLQNDNYYNIDNTQHDGYGLRGEFMAGHILNGYAFQIGPFFRYWDIKTSNVTYTPDGVGWIEPNNNRLQVGAALRVLW